MEWRDGVTQPRVMQRERMRPIDPDDERTKHTKERPQALFWKKWNDLYVLWGYMHFVLEYECFVAQCICCTDFNVSVVVIVCTTPFFVCYI